MLNKEIKDTYIELLKKSNPSDLFMEEISEFINTYDGTNELEFKKIILALVGIFSSHTDYSMDSDTLIKLEKLDNEFDIVAESLRKDYKNIMNNKMRSNYPVPAADDADTV